MKLHEPHGRQRWCGPNALSAISGKSTDDIAADLRQLTERRQITGTHDWQMLAWLDAHGYKVTRLGLRIWTDEPRVTLARWLKLAKAERKAGVLFLISAGNHWQVVSGRRYACGLTREIVSIRDKRVKRRARIKAVWRIFK